MRDDSWGSLNKLLRGDIHPRVRAAAKESFKDYRQRSWAGEHLAAILDIRSGDTQEMLRVWRYGRALSQVGDDETIAKLEEHLRAKHLRSNVRHFLGRLLKLVEKTWEKTKKNWPEPFVPLSGRARTGTCILKCSDAEWSARYSIWAKAAQDISHRPAWGGWATLDHLEQMPEVVGKDATLKLEDAQEYTVFVSASLSSGTLTFSGGDKHPF